MFVNFYSNFDQVHLVNILDDEGIQVQNVCAQIVTSQLSHGIRRSATLSYTGALCHCLIN